MSIEISVKINTEKIKTELTQEEAKELYLELKEFFEVQDRNIYVPYTSNPLIPGEQSWPPTPPYYINDFPPGLKPHVTFNCKGDS